MASGNFNPEIQAAMQDAMRDKAAGIKEDSPQDIARDKKAGISESAEMAMPTVRNAMPTHPTNNPPPGAVHPHAALAAGIAHAILNHR
jgi:hypothetical protein